jgi:acylphosphatase
MSAVRHPDPPRSVHEPLVLYLPGLPAAAAEGPLVTPAELGGNAGGPGSRSRLTVWVEGRVQGVGFRWWVRSRALELGLVGQAENLEDGRVKVIAEGPTGRCEELLALLQGGQSPGRVRRVTARWAAPAGNLAGFIER